MSVREPEAYWAHSRNSQGERQPLEDHLRGVAGLASEFAGAFGAGELGRWAGLWHDVGKHSCVFQDYLAACDVDEVKARSSYPHRDHKSAGTLMAAKHSPPVAFTIWGHHGGLPNRSDLKGRIGDAASDANVAAAIDAAVERLPDLASPPPLPPPTWCDGPFETEMLTRMVFSALVDADFLDTERHFAPERQVQRGDPSPVDDVAAVFVERRADQVASAPSSTVNTAREAIFESVVGRAESPTGMYRLSAPTGSGKTITALGFALEHARRHGLRRIVTAVPYLSITEQLASVYRHLLDPQRTGRVVLEHHSAAQDETGAEGARVATWRRLAAENWDATVIVTTMVQLFDSLLSNRPSHCRKLHRLARSVIVLDEVQTLPQSLLEPTVDVLRQLCDLYGATVVFSTATQPAFDRLAPLAGRDIPDLLPVAEAHRGTFERVKWEWPAAVDTAGLATLIAGAPSILAVCNTIDDAQRVVGVLDQIGVADVLHLSTRLCGAHRRQVLDEVRSRLRAGEPCRLVATQVVEAGVDLDFPEVIRVLGPLPSLAQAAGRCNREGHLTTGTVRVVRLTDGHLPPGEYRQGTHNTEVVTGPTRPDPDDEDVIREWFELQYAISSTDAKGIQPLREALGFPEVAARYHLIDGGGDSVLVPWGTPEEQDHRRAQATGTVDFGVAGRDLWRAWQPFLVALRPNQLRKAVDAGLATPTPTGVYLWEGPYHPVRGIILDAEPTPAEVS